MGDKVLRWLGRIGVLVAIPSLLAAPLSGLDELLILLFAGVIGLAVTLVATMMRQDRLAHRIDQLEP